MDWQCNKCSVWVAFRHEQCSSCGQHWSKVWKKPKQRQRSQSRRKKGDVSKEAIDAKQVEEEEDLTLFTGKTPWIASTPNTRLSTPTSMAHTSTRPEEHSGEEALLTVPPEPVLPKPPQINSMKEIEHLRGLKEVMGQLPEELEARLQQLVAERSTDKALSHSHLNRLVKLQKQLKAQQEKMVKLNEDWRKFVGQVGERFNKHKSLFLETRQQLLKGIREKQEELAAAKDEISRASLSLLQQPTPVEEVAEDLGMEDGLLMESLQEAQASLAAIDEYPEIDMDVEEVPATTGANSAVVKPFTRRVAAGSPTKVAKEHLKGKDKKGDGA